MAEPTEPAKGTIETPLGTVTYVVNKADHAVLDATGRDEQIIVNRVPYRVALHLFLIDGVWKVKDYRDLYMSRADTSGEASFAARDKTVKILTETWNEFMRDHPDLLVTGEIAALTRRVQSDEAEIETLVEKLRLLEADRDMAVTRLRELGYHGPNKQDWSARY